MPNRTFTDKEILQEAIIHNRDDIVRGLFKHTKPENIADRVLLFGHFFLSHYFRDKSPEFHKDLIERFFSNKNEYIAAPRGFSKTTIIQLCLTYSICNQLDNFIVVIEKTFNEASEVIRGVHQEFLDNEKLIKFYGNVTEKQRKKNLRIDPLDEKESLGDVFLNGVRIRGKGFNTPIRGLKSRQWRPSRIILDDVEEDEHISSPEQRWKYRANYDKGIQPAVDIEGSIKMFGTILHQDSLLSNLINQHNGVIYKAFYPDGKLLWEERWSMEKLMKKKQDMMSSGHSSNAFSQEYLNEPVGDEERTFKFDWLWELKDYGGSLIRVPKVRIEMKDWKKLLESQIFNGYAMIDVADTVGEMSDYTGVVVVYVGKNGNRYLVDVRRERRNVKEAIDLIFEIWDEWKGLIKIGIEKKGFNDQILPLFEEEKRKRNKYPIIEELKPMGRNKENRIKGALQGLYELGKVYSVGYDHQGIFKAVGDTEVLLNELYDFPASKHDDISDSLAYMADIVEIPYGMDENATQHINPQDDAYENQETVINSDKNDWDNIDNDPYI